MNKSDIAAMSLTELKELQRNVAKAILSFDDRIRADVREALEALARSHGLSLADFVQEVSVRRRSPSKAKYRHPENPAITWSGRGRRPKWFVGHLAATGNTKALVI